MSQAAGHDNHDGPRLRGILPVLVGAAWVLTMARIVRTEVLVHRESEDMRRLVASARLTRQHASAHYAIRSGPAGDTLLGTLSSTVSGSREEEQLAYIVEGELHAPLRVTLKGVVVASWDRRPDRFAFDVDLAGRHKIEGGRTADGLFQVRYIDPSGDVARTWVVDEPPLLAPGPLPLPQLDATQVDAGRTGQLPNPAGGAPVAWALKPAVRETITLLGEERPAIRREIEAGGAVVTLFTDEQGFPLRVELPGGIVAELAGGIL